MKIELLSKQCRPPPLSLEWSGVERSGVCDPDPFSLNPQTECGIHSSVMLAIYILAEERSTRREKERERRREHFQFVIRRFPKKKRGKKEKERKGVFYFRRVTRDHFVERHSAADLLSSSSASNKNV